MWKCGFIDYNVDSVTPFSFITPIDSFNHVEFQEELLLSTSKHSSHPELLRKLTLEVVNDTPDQALTIYTDSSRLDTGRVIKDTRMLSSFNSFTKSCFIKLKKESDLGFVPSARPEATWSVPKLHPKNNEFSFKSQPNFTSFETQREKHTLFSPAPGLKMPLSRSMANSERCKASSFPDAIHNASAPFITRNFQLI
ncbi:RNase H domain-containing protein [Trichonephila inaurata madagascariensis]|uniref:RNase H domain-containing protein n=1 Tax=Trichonephila inaurata madagascariensis TaxID=2747483 RepID=A0A8X7CP12_9ARAC|nr:RNase H domain-containing protein [Trichonephila inaurata madagascariensis]